jgi:hypothetical protein
LQGTSARSFLPIRWRASSRDRPDRVDETHSSAAVRARRRYQSRLRTYDEGLAAPAYVRNYRFDLLGVNQLGRALFSDLYTAESTRANLARYLFLDRRAQDFYIEWPAVARDAPSGYAIQSPVIWN